MENLVRNQDALPNKSVLDGVPSQINTDVISIAQAVDAQAAAPQRPPSNPKPARPPREPLSKRMLLKLLIAAVLMLMAAVFLARNFVLGTPVETYVASISALQQTVVASGRVAAAQRVSIASAIAGRVAVIPVLEGQIVVRGQLLLALDDQDAKAELAQAKSNVTQAGAGVRKQRALTLPSALQALASAQSQQDQAWQQFQRITDLRKRSFVSQAQLEEAKRNFEVTQTQTRSALLLVQSNRAKGGDAIAVAASLAQAQANAQLALVKLDHHAILAPVSGTLISRNVEPGDIVLPGSELMQLAPLGRVEIVLLLDEKHLAKLAIGEKALASADAYPDERFAAQVSYINPGVDGARGAVMIKLRVGEAPDYLREDMTVSVDIETGYRAQALVIPTAAVRDLSGKAPWVMVVRNKRTVRQVVTLGLRGDEQLEVLSGLSTGEAVLPATLKTIRVGQRVRARPATLAPDSTL